MSRGMIWIGAFGTGHAIRSGTNFMAQANNDGIGALARDRATAPHRETSMHDRDVEQMPAGRKRFSTCLIVAAVAGAAAFGSLLGAAFAADYPTRPIRLFVPYGPGGVGDL